MCRYSFAILCPVLVLYRSLTTKYSVRKHVFNLSREYPIWNTCLVFLVLRTMNRTKRTFSNGCLGSQFDEERCELRYLVWFALLYRNHRNFERTAVERIAIRYLVDHASLRFHTPQMWAMVEQVVSMYLTQSMSTGLNCSTGVEEYISQCINY